MTLAVAALAAATLVVVPAAVDRWARGRASPKALVRLAFAALCGMALVPLALAACLSLFEPHGHRPARPLTLLAAAALSGMTGGRALLAWRRGRARWEAIAGAVRAAEADAVGKVAVVALVEPAAFVAGRTAVVSSALLNRLPAGHAAAVVAHEEAHLEGRHPTLALAAHALATGAFRVPPARRAERRLRHELEVIADARAARRLGDPQVVAAALSAVGSTDRRPELLEFGDDTIDDRIARLQRVHGPTRWADRVATATAGATGALALATVCTAAHDRLLWAAIVACTVVSASYVWALRPLGTTRS